jgi:hypothetical protein
MSNHYAIATVTATLQQLLNQAVSADVPGASATMVTPDGPASGVPDTGVNAFLYQVTPNAAWRNEDLPTRDSSSRLMSRPRTAVDLHYLLTFYGDDGTFEPQRVLASTIRTLHAKPVLTRPQIEDALTAYPVLAPSNLAADVELVKLTELPLSLEELSKLWSVFFQTTYRLSVAYRGTVVLIESDAAYSAPLPVLRRKLYAETLREPRVDQVVAASADTDPILAGSAVTIRGAQLVGESVDVRIDGIAATNVQVAAQTHASAVLPALPAGVHGLQVVHERLLGVPPVPHPAAIESNVFPFVLAPKVKKNGAYDITLANETSRTVATVTYHSADVTLVVEPVVGRSQRVALVLNELVAADARSYTFVGEPRPADTDTITIRAVDVLPGQYLVRIQIDGAESPLDVTAGSYSDPAVTL